MSRKTDPYSVINYILGLLCLSVLAYVLFIYSFRNITDLDIWLHLKTGKLIIANKAVFFNDPFSFTLNNKPWVDHAWLFQVLVYSIYNLFSFNGLFALQAIVVVLSLAIFIFSVYKKENIFLIAIGGLFILILYLTRLTIRPDIFSVLFFSYYLFSINKLRNSRLIYTLVPIQILWVNFHGYFILGPLIILAYLLDGYFRKTWVSQDNEFSELAHKRLKTVFYLLLLASFVNPYTYKVAFYPISVIFNSLGQNKIFFSKIQELRPAVQLKSLFDIESSTYLKILAFLSGISFFLNCHKFKIRDLILWLLFLILALIAVRHTVYFAFFAAMVFVKNMEEFIKIQDFVVIKYKKLKMLLHYIMRVFFLIFVIGSIQSLLSSDIYSFQGHRFVKKIGNLADWAYPTKAADFIIKNNLPQRMFNDFNSGSYIIGKAYPGRKVFIDGRTELYGADFFSRYELIMDGDDKEIKKAMNKYNLKGFLISYAFTEPKKKLLCYLYKSKNWVPVFFDEGGIIFLLRDKNNRALINKFKIDLDHWQPPAFDSSKYGSSAIYPQPYLQRANVFRLLDLSDSQIREASMAIQIYPSASAYNLRGEGYFNKGMYDEALADFKVSVFFTNGNCKYLVDVGKVYLAMNNYELAMGEFKKALDLDRNFDKAYFYLGKIYFQQKQYNKAISNFKIAIKLNAKNYEYFRDLARVYLEIKQYKLALKFAKKAFILDKDDRLTQELLENIPLNSNP